MELTLIILKVYFVCLGYFLNVSKVPNHFSDKRVLRFFWKIPFIQQKVPMVARILMCIHPRGILLHALTPMKTPG